MYLTILISRLNRGISMKFGGRVPFIKIARETDFQGDGVEIAAQRRRTAPDCWGQNLKVVRRRTPGRPAQPAVPQRAALSQNCTWHIKLINWAGSSYLTPTFAAGGAGVAAHKYQLHVWDVFRERLQRKLRCWL